MIKNIREVFDRDSIKLKDTYNIPMIVLIVVIIVISTVLLTSNFWLPDERDKMTYVKKENNFNYIVLMLDEKSYQIDYAENIAEVNFQELEFTNDEVVSLKYKVYDENGNKLPSNVIKSDGILEDSIMTKDVLLQFGVPNDIYYVKIEVIQDNLTYDYTIDYRDFKETKVIERTKSYLKVLEKEQKELKVLQNDLKIVKEQLKNKKDDNTLEDKKIVLEQKIKTKKSIIEKIKNGTYDVENNVKEKEGKKHE